MPKGGSSIDAFAYSYEEEPRKKGIHFGPFPLFLLVVVILASLATIITLSVLFANQAAELEGLKKNATASPGSTVSGQTPAPDATTARPPSTVLPPGSTTNSSSAVDWPNYRLPGNIDTVSYDVWLKINLPFDENSAIGDGSKDFTTEGIVTIEFIVKEPLRVVILHSWNLTIAEDDVVILNVADKNLVQTFQFDEQRHLLKILLTEDLHPADKPHQLTITFNGKIMDDNQGLYRSSYTVNGTKRYLATSQFEAYKLRRVFPCFDEPLYRATFNMALEYDNRFNGTYFITKEKSRTDSAETDASGIRWRTTVFEPTVRMAPYALAFLISDFARESIDSEQLEFGGISRPDAIGDTEFATKVGRNMTLFLGSPEFLNEPYTNHNKKMDQLAAPDFDSGAMENWGLIIYRERLMLYRPGSSSAEDKKEVGRVVAHELAHQWFGNILTCQWWSEIFLNEGFAAFMEFPVTMHARPDWDLDKLFTISETRVAYDADSYPTSHPLWNPNVTSRVQIDNMFSRITYQKGASVYRMIEAVMGTDNFYAALRAYFQTNKGKGSVTPPDLFEAFTNQMNGRINITQRFDKWFTTNGFPLVSMAQGSNKNKYTVSQRRFMLGNVNASSGQMDRTWQVPFHYQTKDRSGNLVSNLGQEGYASEGSWLAGPTRSIDVGEHEWILANVGHKGFYRVNYTAENWMALINQLKTNHEVIDMLSRNQLVDDSFTLARIGQMDYSVPISMTQYLGSEYEYPPWSTALEHFNYINRMLGGNEESLKNFVLNLLNPRYNENLWNTDAVWIDEVRELYVNLTMNIAFVENSCFYGSLLCLTTASSKFAEFKKDSDDPEYKINPHLKDQIYCYGMRAGNAADFDFLQAQYEAESVHNAKLSILKGMACSNDSELIGRYLDMSLQEDVVRPQDLNYIFRYVSKFPANNLQGWNFFKVHWDDIPEGFRDNIIVDVAGKFNTQEQYNDVQSLFNEKGGDSSDFSEKDAFKQALNRIASNIEWVTKYSDSILTAIAGLDWNSATGSTSSQSTATSSSIDERDKSNPADSAFEHSGKRLIRLENLLKDHLSVKSM
ncbi:hypothetical protein RvY_10367-2 [Ramazzottius varieornatus]|uniref:Aminopeptidase n=1 Tax=Ramazzottius varieornatus TaxID=947166 RepID=A0A1D1VCJ8_RAMVA|nr:hypothetical protein RvY_10367-2 [Ramazzottius varieornatus]